MHRYIVLALFLTASTAAVAPVFAATGEPDRDLVSIAPKRNVFVLAAFLLAASSGTDSAGSEGGPVLEHPLRQLVRAELHRRLGPGYLNDLRSFCERNGLRDSRAFCPDWIPDAVGESEPVPIPDTSTIQGRIADFAMLADIDELWNSYRDVITLESEEYRSTAHAAIARITAYLGLDPGYIGTRLAQVHFQVNPLLDYESAQTIRIDNNLYVIAGPTAKGPTEHIFFHELLHLVLEPLTIRYAKEIDRSAALFDLVPANGTAPEKTWPMLVEDCFVRSIAAELTVQADGLQEFRAWDIVDREYADNRILCPFIHYRLRAQQPGKGQSLEDWYRQTVAAIDVARERQRYKDARAAGAQ